MFTSPDLHFRAFTALDIDVYAGIGGEDPHLAEVDLEHTAYVVVRTTTTVAVLALSHEGDMLWEVHNHSLDDAAFLLNQLRFDNYRGSLGAHRYVCKLFVGLGWTRVN